MKEIRVEHKVDSGVPIPIKKGLPLAELSAGESIQFPLSDRRRVATQASTMTRRTGKKFTIRKESDETARVWRV